MPLATALPTREILWNVNTLATPVIMYSLFAVALFIGLVGIWRHGELWFSGKPAPEREQNLLRRAFDLYQWGLLQHGVVRERAPAIIHTLIYFGFLVLLFTTTMVFIDHDLGIRIYQGNFYLAVTLMSDVFGLALIVGCLLAAHRRYIEKAPLLHNRKADSTMITVLILLCLQGYVLEGLRIHVTRDPWAAYSPVGLLFAKFFWALTPQAARAVHFFFWWFHTVTVFAVVALAPYSKFFHIISSSANLFFRATARPKGALPFPGDIEKMVEKGDEFTIGTSTIKDYSWKQLLDLDACTSCGRCQNACPAYLSGKPLSPKWLILDTRNHALTLNADRKLEPSLLPKPLVQLDNTLMHSFLLKPSGLLPLGAADGGGYQSSGAFRGENELVQLSALRIGASADQKISGEVMEENVFWSCNTCMACVEACPVGINHVDQIVENRRAKVLMEGSMPHEAQKTLRTIESQGNPYGPASDRIKWLGDLPVKILQPGDEVDYLYWVGCVSSYDPRKQKIAQSLARLMLHAGLSFGILGNAEGCSGDPARRLGEENLFQLLAKQNINLLKSLKFKVLVANCPHCFNTIKNEYPQLGNLGEGRTPEIIHHSQLLKKLVKDGALAIEGKVGEGQFTFHDPCYLGRYNEEYDAPREVLSKSSRLPILEMERSKEKGMCCGAGGGHYWMDLKIGSRVNVLRVEQATATGANKIATACPFCLQMMEDGVNLTNRQETTQVKDIAEVLCEAVFAPPG